VQLHHAKQALI